MTDFICRTSVARARRTTRLPLTTVQPSSAGPGCLRVVDLGGWCTSAPAGVLLHHPTKEIAGALRLARNAGMLVRRVGRGHRWGEVWCEPCQARAHVWSTPRNTGTHAKQIVQFVDEHTHPERR